MRTQRPKERMLGLMEKQRQIVTRAQLRSCGYSDHQIHRMLVAIDLVKVLPGTFGAAGAPFTWERKLQATLLWAGNGWAVGFRSAARVWRFDNATDDVLELVGTRRLKSPRPDIVLHRAIELPRGHLTNRDGFLVTCPWRTILDLGSVVDVSRVEDAVESACRFGLVTHEYLERKLAEHARRGHRGCAALRLTLEARRGLRTTDSAFETELFRLLRKSRLPLPERQIPVYDTDGTFIARPDFLYREARLAIEALSRRHHFGGRAVDADAARRNRLLAAGYGVIEVTYREMRENPDEVIDQIARALGARLF